jgi:hypothetical protein
VSTDLGECIGTTEFGDFTESAPLIRDTEREEHRDEDHNASFADRVNAVAREPLTPLTKILLVVSLVLLLLSSVSTCPFCFPLQRLGSGLGIHRSLRRGATQTQHRARWWRRGRRSGKGTDYHHYNSNSCNDDHGLHNDD